jgi:Tetratricopeptide repeat
MSESSERIETLRRELAANPASRQFYQLGELLRRDGRAGEAIEVLRRGLASSPRYVAAWVSLGRAELDANDGKQAAEALREAIALDPANPVAWRLLGEARMAVGHTEGALSAFERALDLAPGDDVLQAVVEDLRATTAATAESEAANEPLAPAETPTVGEVAPTSEAPLTAEAFPFVDEPQPTTPAQSSTTPDVAFALESPRASRADDARFDAPPAVEVARAVVPSLEALERAASPWEAGERPGVPASSAMAPPDGDPFDIVRLAAAETPGGADDVFVFATAVEAQAVRRAETPATPASEVPPPASGPALAAEAPALEAEPSAGPFGIAGPLVASFDVFGAVETSPLTVPELAASHVAAAPVEAEVPAPASESAVAPAEEMAAPAANEAELEETSAAPLRFAGAADALEVGGEMAVQPPAESPVSGGGPVPAEEPETQASVAPGFAGPATVTMARLYIQQQELGAAAAILDRVLEALPTNQEARDLLELVRDMMEPLPESLPPLSRKERKIASLQRWLASLTLAHGRTAG